MYVPLEENTVVLNDSMMMVPSLSFCLLSVGLQILQDFPTRRKKKKAWLWPRSSRGPWEPRAGPAGEGGGKAALEGEGQ